MLVTPAPDISIRTHKTLEQRKIQIQLMNLGVELATQTNLSAAETGKVELSCIFTEKKIERVCDSLLLVTERLPNDGLFKSLNVDSERLTGAGIKTLKCIGDSFAPATIAAAIYSGHLAARELQAEPQEDVPFLRERIQV